MKRRDPTLKALELIAGGMSRESAARKLGVSRTTLWRKLRSKRLKFHRIPKNEKPSPQVFAGNLIAVLSSGPSPFTLHLEAGASGASMVLVRQGSVSIRKVEVYRCRRSSLGIRYRLMDLWPVQRVAGDGSADAVGLSFCASFCSAVAESPSTSGARWFKCLTGMGGAQSNSPHGSDTPL